MARLFPNQGGWSDHDYLILPTNNLVELSDGVLVVLPMPTTEHQRIVAFLYQLLNEFLKAGNLGTVLFAPLRVRLWEGKFREPDLLVMLTGEFGPGAFAESTLLAGFRVDVVEVFSQE